MNKILENISKNTTVFLFISSLLMPFILLIIFLITIESVPAEFQMVFLVIFILISLTCLFFIIPLRYLLRQKMMKNVANEFNLKFSTSSPRFLDIIMPLAWFKYRGKKVNIISGNIGNYTIEIADILFAKSIFWFIFGNNQWQYTTVNINENKEGKEISLYEKGRMRITLKPVILIRKILNEVHSRTA